LQNEVRNFEVQVQNSESSNFRTSRLVLGCIEAKFCKEFIALGKIRETDIVKGGNFDPTQRRNPGAPPTAEIEAQMGTSAYALYKPIKDGQKSAINQ